MVRLSTTPTEQPSISIGVHGWETAALVDSAVDLEMLLALKIWFLL